MIQRKNPMSFRSIAIASLATLPILVSGCADNQSLLGNSSSNLTTAAVPATPKIDPACSGLASQIDALRKDGIADKMDKATQKKTKVSLTATETAKADQLNKANFEFQAKCSNFKPSVATAAPSPVATVPATATNVTATAKAATDTAGQAKVAAKTATTAARQ